MRTVHWIGLLAAAGASVGGWAWWRKTRGPAPTGASSSSALVAPKQVEGTDTTTVVAKALSAVGVTAPEITMTKRMAYAISIPAGATVAEKARLVGF